MEIKNNQYIAKGCLHSHTTNSDGNLRPKELINLYRSLGFDFLAITDHNYITKVTSPYNDFIVLQGFEDTFKYHINHIEDEWNETGEGLTFLCHPDRWNLKMPEIERLINRYNLLGVEKYNRRQKCFDGYIDCLTFANDDFHARGMEGKSWNEVTIEGKFTKKNLLKAIRQGKIELKSGEFPTPEGEEVQSKWFKG